MEIGSDNSVNNNTPFFGGDENIGIVLQFELSQSWYALERITNSCASFVGEIIF